MGLFRLDILTKLLAVATEISEFSDPARLRKVGERICNLERVFNVREGFRCKDDPLPKRVLKDPPLKGPGDGQRINSPDAFLDAFYDECGWTLNGIPRPEKLQDLGLDISTYKEAPFEGTKPLSNPWLRSLKFSSVN